MGTRFSFSRNILWKMAPDKDTGERKERKAGEETKSKDKKDKKDSNDKIKDVKKKSSRSSVAAVPQVAALDHPVAAEAAVQVPGLPAVLRARDRLRVRPAAPIPTLILPDRALL